MNKQKNEAKKDQNTRTLIPQKEKIQRAKETKKAINTLAK